MSDILNAIYEPIFLDCSFGFRPNRNCHMALKKLDNSMYTKPVHFVIDADIKGYFDHINQSRLQEMLKFNINDKNFTYYVSELGVLVHNRCVNLKPDPNAQGPHSVFRTDKNGNVTHYTTYETNSYNPSGFQEVIRVDVVGSSHNGIPTPHVHVKGIKDPRSALPFEIPKWWFGGK